MKDKVMTPTSHNRTLGLLHLLYGVFCIALMVLVTFFISGTIDAMAVRGEAVPVATFAVLIVGGVFVSLILITPSFITAYALLKRKRWARRIGILAGVLAGLTFPFGTALCVYTLWFLFGEKGKFLYHKAAYALPPQPEPRRKLKKLLRASQPYVPPTTPPDWR
ncbi:MAG: hypothetical protein M3447_05895 [Acidobacteriota bacterium]|nr:hypothetical protein [Acidobacteriota bacterium]